MSNIPEITVKKGNFFINGQETMLIGGEIHYFRVPKDQWKDRILKAKEAGFNLISTYIPWIIHEKEEGIYDFEDQKDIEYFLKLIKEQNMYCLLRPGPYVMSELKNEGLPNWIFENYPEIRAVDRNGQKHNSKTVSYNHPVFLNNVSKWYKKICGIISEYLITSGGPVILFQLDNEVGMMNWITNNPDLNDFTVNEFIKYLQNTENKSFTKDEIITAMKSENKNSLYIQNSYMEFMRFYYKNYFLFLKNEAEKNSINVPFVVNVHGFTNLDYAKRGNEYPIGLSQLKEVMRTENIISAGDYYIGNIISENYTDIIISNIFTKALQNKEQPLFSAEFQSGSIFNYPKLQPCTHELNTRICVGNGMKGFNYYMFAGGKHYEDGIWIFNRYHDWQAPVSPDGEKRISYDYIKNTVNILKASEKEIINSENIYDVCFGFYPDYFRTEYKNEIFEIIKNKRNTGIFYGFLRGVLAENYQTDAVNIIDEEIEKYDKLIIFSTAYMDEKIQLKIVNYINNGGNVLLYPEIPVYNMNGEKCEILKNFINTDIVSDMIYRFADVLGTECIAVNSAQTYSGLKSNEILGKIEETDETAVFQRKIGKGKIIVMGINFEMNFIHHKNFIKEIMSYFGVKKHTDIISEDINLSVKKYKESYLFFINNFDEYEKEFSIKISGKDISEGNKFKIKGKSGLLLYRNLNLGNTVLEYSSAEICEKGENSISFLCRQKKEIIKFNKKVKNFSEKNTEEKENGFYICRDCEGEKIKFYF